MLAALAVDLGNTVAEFAGVAAAMQIFGISKYISVPLAGIVVWFLVVREALSQVEKIFLVACGFYISYVVLRHPGEAGLVAGGEGNRGPTSISIPAYVLMLTALVGTTIAPWQFFYLQAGFVEKKVGARQYKHAN